MDKVGGGYGAWASKGDFTCWGVKNVASGQGSLGVGGEGGNEAGEGEL